MDSETYNISLVGGSENEQATVLIDEEDDACHITFHYRGRIIEAKASDFFEAFCSIRKQLEPEKLIPFCYGASLNVFPSGMARDMGAGLSAYRMKIGEHAKLKDLVPIFNSGPDVIPASVADQKRYFKQWVESPKR